MKTHILSYLEESARRLPDKTAVIAENDAVTFAELSARSRSIGSALCAYGVRGNPVAVYLEKSIGALCAFLGIAWAGGCYCLFNPQLPHKRLSEMQAQLGSSLMITDRANAAEATSLFKDITVLVLEDLLQTPADSAALCAARAAALDTDPLYINFTSGSTGTPKGIAVAHRSVLDFIDCFTDLFNINEQDVIANQAPFDFDVSVKDIYSALKTGATLLLIPRRLFSAPIELLDYLCEHRATTLIWAVSALCLVSTFHALDYKTPESVNKILFSGEVMPQKHLLCWQQHLPRAQFVNLYGPTEITCNCTYHRLDPERDYAAGIPIGRPFPNEQVLLLDEYQNAVTEPGEVGEICVRGSALALGYWRCPEQTAAHFVQNPLQDRYPELIYRTGDLGRYNDDGELIFCGRKDFQIKYMGHRIELEEIERAMAAIEGVERCCCVFDEKRSRLLGFYLGSCDKQALLAEMQKQLPIFMIPGRLRQLTEMPLNKNGKIDRRKLLEMK